MLSEKDTDDIKVNTSNVLILVLMEYALWVVWDSTQMVNRKGS